MAKVIKLTENQFGEMMAYHGSNSDFDKFNHKKYLSTGAGSQVFGWGTYVTDDEAIGRSYARSSINIHKHMHEIPDILTNTYGLSNDECFDVIEKFYDWTNGFNIPVRDLSKEVTKRDIIGYMGSKYMKYADMFLTIINYCRTDSERTNTLYEVDIPDDNGFNYLSWYDKPTNEQQKAIKDGLYKLEKRLNRKILTIYSFISGMAAYKEMASTFTRLTNGNGYKAASLFLMQCGFDGIKYPAGTKWQKPDGAAEDAYNYVIFDANKVKIVNKTRM